MGGFPIFSPPASADPHTAEMPRGQDAAEITCSPATRGRSRQLHSPESRGAKEHPGEVAAHLGIPESRTEGYSGVKISRCRPSWRVPWLLPGRAAVNGSSLTPTSFLSLFAASASLGLWVSNMSHHPSCWLPSSEAVLRPEGAHPSVGTRGRRRC